MTRRLRNTLIAGAVLTIAGLIALNTSLVAGLTYLTGQTEDLYQSHATCSNAFTAVEILPGNCAEINHWFVATMLVLCVGVGILAVAGVTQLRNRSRRNYW